MIIFVTGKEQHSEWGWGQESGWGFGKLPELPNPGFLW